MRKLALLAFAVFFFSVLSFNVILSEAAVTGCVPSTSVTGEIKLINDDGKSPATQLSRSCGYDSSGSKYGMLYYSCSSKTSYATTVLTDSKCPAPTTQAKTATTTAATEDKPTGCSPGASEVKLTYSGRTLPIYKKDGCGRDDKNGKYGYLHYVCNTSTSYGMYTIQSSQCQDTSSSTSPASAACIACIKSGLGFNSQSGKCVRGDATGTFDGTASLTKGNWVYFDTEARKNIFVRVSSKYAGSYSCEALPVSNQVKTNEIVPTKTTDTAPIVPTILVETTVPASDSKPTISTDTYYSSQTNSQIIRVSAKDDFGLERIEIFVDDSSIATCDITGSISTYCVKSYSGSVGSSHSYYVKATSKSKMYSVSDKKSFTIPSESSKTGATASAITSNLIIFGYDMCVSCVDSGKGYYSSSQTCGPVPESGSLTSALSTGKIIIHKKDSEVSQSGERSCDGVLLDEMRTAQGLPTAGGDNFYVLYRSSGAYTVVTEPKGPKGNIVCESCFQEGNMGFNTDTQKCEKGGPTSSSSKSATVAKGNWVGVLTEEAKQAFVVVDKGYSGMMSCETYLNKEPTIDKITVVDNVPGSKDSTQKLDQTTSTPSSTTKTSLTPSAKPSLESCLACIKLNPRGYVTTTGKCELGFPMKSKESTASVSSGDWVWFDTKNLRDAFAKAKPDTYAGALSCEEKFPGEVVYGTPTVPKNVMSTSMKSCLDCVKLANKGYVSTTGKCEAGTSVGSKESTASVSSGNWVYFSSDAIMNNVITARPDLYSKGLSCEKLKPVSDAPAPSQSETVVPNKPSVESCIACMKLANKGYSWSTGRCESGNPAFSSESSASVLNRDWIYYTNDAMMNVLVSLKPDLYPRGLSCEFMNIVQKPASQGTEPSCSSWTSCSTCTQGATDSCGWDKTANACKKGAEQGSSDEAASLSKNNWVWYATENDRASKPGMSC